MYIDLTKFLFFVCSIAAISLDHGETSQTGSKRDNANKERNLAGECEKAYEDLSEENTGNSTYDICSNKSGEDGGEISTNGMA